MEDEPEPETKIKKERSDAQKEQLNFARKKALEMRKQRADERKIQKEEFKIETKMTAIEKEKEILRLKQVAVENKLDIDINPKETPPKKKAPEPVVEAEPEMKQSFCYDTSGNLMFYE